MLHGPGEKLMRRTFRSCSASAGDRAAVTGGPLYTKHFSSFTLKGVWEVPTPTAQYILLQISAVLISLCPPWEHCDADSLWSLRLVCLSCPAHTMIWEQCLNHMKAVLTALEHNCMLLWRTEHFQLAVSGLWYTHWMIKDCIQMIAG
jgi:hypothetical protein